MLHETTKIRDDKTIRLTIPAKVAFNLDRLQKSIVNLVDRLGCTRCFSGFDCTFTTERMFRVDPDSLKIDTIPLPENPLAIGTWPTPERDVGVLLPPKVSNDIESVQKVVESIVERLGCTECTSGRTVSFIQERMMVVDDQLNIQSHFIPDKMKMQRFTEKL